MLTTMEIQEPKAEIEYEITLEDLRASLLYVLRQQKYRINLLAHRILIIVAWIVWTGCIFAPGAPVALRAQFIALSIAAALGFRAMPSLCEWELKRHACNIPAATETDHMIGRCRMAVTPYGVEMEDDDGDSRTKWRVVDRI